MDAAADALGRKGPRFTMADVAELAGVATATVAMRFGSKQALLLAMTAVAKDDLIARMRAAADAETDPVRSIAAAALSALAGGGDPSATANHLSQLGADLVDPDLRASLSRLRDDYREELRVLLEKVPLPNAPSAVQAARILAGLVHGLQLDWALAPDGDMLTTIGSDVDTLLAWWSGAAFCQPDAEGD
ncbi:putative TetR-family transcriptional regulator [Actinoplanes missouriensis 431]|uniref:Putative TetR-family transcriptional regulator n=2 Tax=Actinoplanes missouriensis TaxID=1866 RepID=I0H5Y9_ACTM4|nr:putative TetR-family transcriptional regulator [Actinoplanes missouriensis 431]